MITLLFWTDIFVWVCLHGVIDRRPAYRERLLFQKRFFDVQVLKRKWTLFSRITTSAFQINRSLYIYTTDRRFHWTRTIAIHIIKKVSTDWIWAYFRHVKLQRGSILWIKITAVRNLHFPCYCQRHIAESLGSIPWKHSDGHKRVRKFMNIKTGFSPRIELLETWNAILGY